MNPLLFRTGSKLVLLAALGLGCAKTDEPAQAAQDPGVAAPTAAAPTPAAPTPAAPTMRAEPPAVPAPAVPPASAINLNANIRVDEAGGSAGASVTVQGNVGAQGPSLNVRIDAPEERVAAPAPAPAPQPAAGPQTCKSVLLEKGHPAASLVHCDGVDEVCAVALLKAGHAPAQLVHCGDIEDVGCALQVLRSGRAPAQIVHCD